LAAMLLRGETPPEDGYSVEAYELATRCHAWADKLVIPDDALIEERVEIRDSITGDLLTFGTVDIGYLFLGQIHGQDHKSGQDPEHPDKVIYQIKDYLLGLLQKHDVQGGRFVAYYPRSGFEICVEWAGQDRDEWELQVIERKRRCEDESEPCAIGPWCRTCPGAAICPAANQATQQLATAENLERLPAAKINELACMVKDIVEPMCKSVMKRAKELEEIEEGSMPGFRLTTRGDRSAEAEDFRRFADDATMAACTKTTFSVAEFEKLWSKTMMENAARTGAPAPTKAALRREFAETFKDIIKVSQTRPLRRVAQK